MSASMWDYYMLLEGELKPGDWPQLARIDGHPISSKYQSVDGNVMAQKEGHNIL